MCNDFTTCNGYSCCAKKGKMRVQCGSDKPHMCDLSEKRSLLRPIKIIMQ